MSKPDIALVLGGKPGKGPPPDDGPGDDEKAACRDFFESAGLHTHDGNHIVPLSSDKAKFDMACEALVSLIKAVSMNADKDEDEEAPDDEEEPEEP